MATNGLAVEVRHRPEHQRFEALIDDQVVGFAAYRDQPGTRVFTHTEVEDRVGRQGVGTRLVGEALDATQAEGLAVVPRCSFVHHFIDQHPGYRDLLAG